MVLDTYVQTPLTTGEVALSNSWCLLRGITSKAVITSGQQSELAGFGQGSCYPRPIKISTFLKKTLKAFSNVAEAATGKAERRACTTNILKMGQLVFISFKRWMKAEATTIKETSQNPRINYIFVYLHAHTIHATEISLKCWKRWGEGNQVQDTPECSETPLWAPFSPR